MKGAEFSTHRGDLGNQKLLSNGNHVPSIIARWPHLPLAKVLSPAHLQWCVRKMSGWGRERRTWEGGDG